MIRHYSMRVLTVAGFLAVTAWPVLLFKLHLLGG
jgi:hypothetical protein